MPVQSMDNFVGHKSQQDQLMGFMLRPLLDICEQSHSGAVVECLSHCLIAAMMIAEGRKDVGFFSYEQQPLCVQKIANMS